MKLTRDHKEDFVKAVMADVPQIDYQQMISESVTKAWRDLLPPDLLECMDKYPQHFDSGYVGTYRVIGWPTTKQESEVWKSSGVDALEKQSEEQAKQRLNIRIKLRRAIEGCETVQYAREFLPEFADYLPADTDSTGVKNLHAVTDVVSDLVAAGWKQKGGRK